MRHTAKGARSTTASRVLVACMTAALLGAAAGLATGATPAAASKHGDELDPSKITPAMVELGRAIFHGKGSCFACHGAALEGTQIAPTLKTHAWRDAKNGDYAAIFGVITKGVSGTVMVAFPGGISKSEALSVASYVWQVGQQKAKP
jgi:mono/diheme cytochrome c family protein